MAMCEMCFKEYDEDEVVWDFGDILMEKYGYQGDVLRAAIDRCFYQYCAECNADIFDPVEFEDDYCS